MAYLADNISIPYAKRKIKLLVSRAWLKERAVSRGLGYPALPICKSAQEEFQAGHSSHTLYSPPLQDEAVWGIGFSGVGWSHRGDSIFTRFGVPGNLPGAGSSAHRAGWHLHGESVPEKLFTVRHRLGKIKVQALHLCVTNAGSGGLCRGGCLQALLPRDGFSA